MVDVSCRPQIKSESKPESKPEQKLDLSDNNCAEDFSSVDSLIQDIRQGKMVILMDDPDRENEGDLVMAAECVTPESINFMATHGRGLICMPLTQSRAQQLNLALMAAENTNASSFATKFTNSIEAASGVTTGISAADRAHTIKSAVAKTATAQDLVQPGHVFPIIAERGGVLSRAGHTEASCDYARLAGFEPAAVIVEVLNADGTMARRDDLFTIASKFNLKIGTIADLIKYRMQHEQTVKCVYNMQVQTKFGNFNLKMFEDLLSQQLHCVLIKGDPTSDSVVVRVHDIDPITDILGLDLTSSDNSSSNNLSQAKLPACSLNEVFAYVQKVPDAVVILLDRQLNGQSWLTRLKALGLDKLLDNHKQTPGDNIVNQNFNNISETPSSLACRQIGAGSRILHALGVSKMQVLGNSQHYAGLAGFGLQVLAHVDPKTGGKIF